MVDRVISDLHWVHPPYELQIGSRNIKVDDVVRGSSARDEKYIPTEQEMRAILLENADRIGNPKYNIPVESFW